MIGLIEVLFWWTLFPSLYTNIENDDAMKNHSLPPHTSHHSWTKLFTHVYEFFSYGQTCIWWLKIIIGWLALIKNWELRHLEYHLGFFLFFGSMMNEFVFFRNNDSMIYVSNKYSLPSIADVFRSSKVYPLFEIKQYNKY